MIRNKCKICSNCNDVVTEKINDKPQIYYKKNKDYFCCLSCLFQYFKLKVIGSKND